MTFRPQDAQLHAAGCAKVYAEKVSGARSDRPELAKLLRRLEAGDVLMVTRLDRLARFTRDLLNILHMLGERSIGFKSLADAWADTTTAHGRLLVTMLAGIAEFERELIRARTGEGRKRAQARGVKFGRPPKLSAPAAFCGRERRRILLSAGCRGQFEGYLESIGAGGNCSRANELRKRLKRCVLLVSRPSDEPQRGRLSWQHRGLHPPTLAGNSS